MAGLRLTPRELREYIREYTGREVTACMQCGLCTAVCPVAGFMDLHPAALIRAVQLSGVDLAKLKSIWVCVSCMTCVDKCPRDVAPGLVIETLRQLALKSGIEPRTYSQLLVDETTPSILLVAYSRKSTG
ncbi:MAG: 4Fe-4S dicluster domain-containing protein [Desulfurococcaceae archaeon]|nr:4Fe-4S dicluster domain-containing protein [Desulfurococcaceae archaeon]